MGRIFFLLAGAIGVYASGNQRFIYRNYRIFSTKPNFYEIFSTIRGSDLSRIRFFTRFLRAQAGGRIKKKCSYLHDKQKKTRKIKPAILVQ